MTTPKNSWNGLRLVVDALWLAALAYLCIHFGFRGNHPESLHAFYCLCALGLFYGTPFVALYSTGAVYSARSSGDTVPPIAVRSRNSAWILTGVVAAWIIGHFIAEFFTQHGQPIV